MYEVKMPQWGMEMTEGVVVKWHKTEGDRVEKGEDLADIENAKSTGTLEAPASGRVVKLIAKPEQEVPIYGLLAIIDDDQEPERRWA